MNTEIHSSIKEQYNMFLIPPKPQLEYVGPGLFRQIREQGISHSDVPSNFSMESFFEDLERPLEYVQEYSFYCDTAFAHKMDEQFKSYWIYEEYKDINPHRHPAGAKIARRVIKELRSYKRKLPRLRQVPYGAKRKKYRYIRA